MGDIFKYESRIFYECNEGYEFEENSSSEFVCHEAGIFVPVSNSSENISLPKLPNCRRVSCGVALQVENALVDVDEKDSAEIFYQVRFNTRVLII